MTGLVDRTLTYVLTPEPSYRVVGPDSVEVTLGDRTMPLPMSAYKVLLEFSQPRTREEVFESLRGAMSMSDFYGLVLTMEGRQLLRSQPRATVEPIPDNALRSLFQPGIVDDDAQIDAIAEQLDAGRAVVIPDAFQPSLADRVHAELDASTSWVLYEDVFPNFHSHHHSLYFDRLFPPSVGEVKAVFDSPDGKRLMSRLTRRDCMGPIDFGASLYLPGDHSLPHLDFGLSRNVAFIWHLTREWQPEWGGALYWCPAGATIVPRFNYLTLFNTSTASAHMVTPVSPHARQKRLAVYGWWTHTPSFEPRQRPPVRTPTHAVIPSEFGPAPTPVGGRGILAL